MVSSTEKNLSLTKWNIRETLKLILGNTISDYKAFSTAHSSERRLRGLKGLTTESSVKEPDVQNNSLHGEFFSPKRTTFYCIHILRSNIPTVTTTYELKLLQLCHSPRCHVPCNQSSPPPPEKSASWNIHGTRVSAINGEVKSFFHHRSSKRFQMTKLLNWCLRNFFDKSQRSSSFSGGQKVWVRAMIYVEESEKGFYELLMIPTKP